MDTFVVKLDQYVTDDGYVVGFMTEVRRDS